MERASNEKDDVIEIDVDAVVRERLPRYYRFIPRALTRWLERIICQRELNEMLRVNRGKRGAEFCRGVIGHLDIDYRVEGEENLPADGRVIFVSNHPLGGLDGMILIDMLSRRYGPGVRFVVNDLLMAVEPLREVFLPVNKHGKQSRESTVAIDEAFAGPAPIIVFPAGLVSRKGSDGRVADLKWHKMFVNKAIASRRDVIPLHFSGRNSKFFYNFAKLRTRLGIPVNLEMVRLPAEVFRCRGSRFVITAGRAVEWTALRGGSGASAQADEIRGLSDALAPDAKS